jgi:hypothetical protein
MRDPIRQFLDQWRAATKIDLEKRVEVIPLNSPSTVFKARRAGKGQPLPTTARAENGCVSASAARKLSGLSTAMMPRR